MGAAGQGLTIAPELVERVVESADGIPLFVEEMVKMLVSTTETAPTVPTTSDAAARMPVSIRGMGRAGAVTLPASVIATASASVANAATSMRPAAIPALVRISFTVRHHQGQRCQRSDHKQWSELLHGASFSDR